MGESPYNPIVNLTNDSKSKSNMFDASNSAYLNIPLEKLQRGSQESISDMSQKYNQTGNGKVLLDQKIQSQFNEMKQELNRERQDGQELYEFNKEL